ncbi:MAG: protein kinase [Candidatus Sumerlaeia bacterium]|nr:protein kinase [Candidatus Sumerlaeia bacterium]
MNESQYPTIPETVRGRHEWKIARSIGQGGFGVVFRAVCADPAQPGGFPPEVAIKLFRPPAGTKVRELLDSELSSLLALRHDRIPRVWDWKLDGEDAFVAMDYYPTGSTRDFLAYDQPFDDAQAWRLLTDLLKALVAAHSAGLLHLDVKPSNVLLDGKGGYVLTDFGISRASWASRQQLPIRGVGTPGYQAPEQFFRIHDQWDVRTDLWGVGATAWSLLTGINLYSRFRELRTKGTTADPSLPSLTDFRPDLPPRLTEVIDALLQTNPEQRPGGAAEVLAEVELFATGSQDDSGTHERLSSHMITEEAIQPVIDAMMDPLWRRFMEEPESRRHVAHFSEGELLASHGEKAHHTFVLLQGTVIVERDGREIARENREGTFLGEVATLAGRSRTANLRAATNTWAAVFNAAQLEKLLIQNPSICLRLVKTLAVRVDRESNKGTEQGA